jgi:mono/diheme cytochrome c family protein
VRRLLRWVASSVTAIFLLGLLLVVAVYVGSERTLRRTYAVGRRAVTLPAATLPADSTALAEGERLARVRGCFGGCHGERFEGQVFFDEPGVARLVAPNLTQAAARWSDPELVRIIRYGVRPNGRSVFSMPSHTFSALSESDLGGILAFLRHTPPEPGPPAELDARWLGRLGLVLGKYQPEAELIPEDATRPPLATPREPLAHGRYLARTICTECHGIDLHGARDGSTPDLRIVAAYSHQAFTRLLREGVPLDGRPLGLMGRVARGRLRYLTDAEIADLYRYLGTPKVPG